MSVHLQEAAGMAVLIDACVNRIAGVKVADPFATQVVVVGSAAMVRPLKQRLSRRLGAGRFHDGVAAGIEVETPAQLVRRLERAQSGVEPEVDPWRPDQLAFTILGALDEVAGADELLARYLHLDGVDTASAGGRRLQLAHRMADRFERYRQWRPDLLADWAEGAPGEVPDDCDWQRRLWLMVRDRIDGPDPVTRLRELVGVLQESGATAVTRELCLLDPLGSSQLVLRVLRALATHHELFLFCPRPGSGVLDRRRREWRQVLERELDVAEVWQLDIGGGRDGAESPESSAPSVPAPVVEVHACHGRSRQVEVTRDTLLRLFAEDPSLAPHDVVIRAAEPRALAPLVRADFAGGGGRPAIPVTTVEHRVQPNEILTVLERLLELVGGRAGVADVCEFAALPPVAAAFELDSQALERLEHLARSAGVRWGFDAAHRRSVGAPAMPQNTWQAGLNRLVAGIALSEDGWPLIGPVLPAGDVEGSDAETIGRFAELVARLQDVAESLRGPVPLAEGISVLQRALADLTAATHTWQSTAAQGLLEGIREDAGVGATGLPEVALSDLRVAVQRRMGERWIAPRLGSGAVTMVALEAAPSWPSRVVVLLGLDDGTFPRPTPSDGDDLVLRLPQLGDPDPAAADAQVCADALANAGQVVIVYRGADEATNALCPPPSPVAEVLQRPAAREVRHPLQPFDARNFTPGALLDGRTFSFDPAAAQAAEAVRAAETARGVEIAEVAGGADASGAVPRAAWSTSDLPTIDDLNLAGTLLLDDLTYFLDDPTRYFFQRSLGIDEVLPTDIADPRVPLELDPLATWAVGERLLQERLAGGATEAVLAAENYRGDLPPQGLGRAVLRSIASEVDAVLAARAHLVQESAAEQVAIDLVVPSLPPTDGVAVGGQPSRLVGMVSTVGGTVLECTFSKRIARQEVAVWARLLCLTAAAEDSTGWIGRIIHRGKEQAAVRTLRPPADPAEARLRLAELVELFVIGSRQPLPFVPSIARGYAANHGRGRPEQVLERAILDSGRYADAFNGRLDFFWGDRVQERLTRPIGPRPLAPSDPSFFGSVARRIWEPILAAQRS